MSRGAAGPLTALAGGVILAAGVVAPWVRNAVVRDVGGVPIVEQVTTSGTEFAGDALLVALAAVILGLAGLVVPPARRVLGAVLWVVAFLGPGMVAWGVLLARKTDGGLTPAPFIAFLAGFLAFLGAALMRSRATGGEPVLDERYTVEGAAAEDAEWELAAEEPPEPAS